MNLQEKLKARRTYKVLGNINELEPSINVEREDIDNILLAAGNAPFHHSCDRLHKERFSSAVPWRAYKLDKAECSNLKDKLIKAGDTTKIPAMLSAASVLIQVTWLPDEGTILDRNAGKEEPEFSGTRRNMEHIAAASAFTQSLLLAAEEQGFLTYWSSGGPLRSETVFDNLKIPVNELLLGSVFLFPKDIKGAEVKPGAMRDSRGSVQDWSIWC